MGNLVWSKIAFWFSRWGNTNYAAGPQGEILVQASNMDEENMVVELDMTRSENVPVWVRESESPIPTSIKQ